MGLPIPLYRAVWIGRQQQIGQSTKNTAELITAHIAGRGASVADGRVTLSNQTKLTTAQRAALTRFEPGQWRGTHPDINPRTASALLSAELIMAEISSGRRQYRLTQKGEQARGAVDEAID